MSPKGEYCSHSSSRERCVCGSSYARTNKDRSYYERVERGEARAWVTSRRATQSAQKALRDPERVRVDELLQVRRGTADGGRGCTTSTLHYPAPTPALTPAPPPIVDLRRPLLMTETFSAAAARASGPSTGGDSLLRRRQRWRQQRRQAVEGVLGRRARGDLTGGAPPHHRPLLPPLPPQQQRQPWPPRCPRDPPLALPCPSLAPRGTQRSSPSGASPGPSTAPSRSLRRRSCWGPLRLWGPTGRRGVPRAVRGRGPLASPATARAP